MKISQLTTRISSFARTALTAAKGKPHLPSAIANRPSPSAPLAMATILRPQARERWMLPQVGAITPQYIEMTLRGALAGAHIPQWELFNLMEDTWPRLRKNIFELKMAVRNRRPVFEAYRDEDMEESPAATERMQLVSAALRKMQPDPTADEGGFDDMLFDILDAWFKGVSVLEIDWHVTQTHRLGRFIAPRCTRWANPVHYAWDTDLRLGLATDAVAGLTEPGPDRRSSPARRRTSGVNDPGYNSPLTAFPADRFIVAKCKTKSGSILGGALLRPLVWWWCAANFSADWLLNLAQIFGLPFRWATYEPTAAQETVDRICAMLQNMGSAGWAAFPAGTSLELKADGQKSGAQTPQGDMLDRADKQCDLLVLGQTLTTDTGGMGSGGGSHALGQVHADVRSGIIDAAAKFTAGILEQQLIPAILRLNYGDCEEAPTLHLQPVTADNLQEKAAILAQLHAAGAGSIIPLDWLGKTFGIPKPKDGEATLADKTPTSPTALFIPKAPIAARDQWDDLPSFWNPDLHPRDTLGKFTHTPESSPSAADKHPANKAGSYGGVDIPGMTPGGEFSDKVLNFLKEVAPMVHAYFKSENPVGQAAALKMIGEEYSTRTGFKGLIDIAQDANASSGVGGLDLGPRDPETHLPTLGIPESWRTGTKFQKLATQVDFLYHDLGPANINLKSAAMLYGITEPGMLNELAAYLVTPEGTARFASDFVKQAQADLNPLIGNMDPDVQTQIITDYVRQGAKTFWGHVLPKRQMTPDLLTSWKAAPNIYIGPNGSAPAPLEPDPKNFSQGQFLQIHSILFDNLNSNKGSR